MRRGRVTAACTLALVLGSAVPAPASLEGVVREANTAGAVAGRYVVVLGEGRADVSAARLAARYGAHVTHTYGSALQGFSVTADDTAARRLAADPAVAYVTQAHRVRAETTQPDPPSWGLDRVDQAALPLDHAYHYPSTAADVTVYVLDTGVRKTHETFAGRVLAGQDFVDAATGDAGSDPDGHGTHVAATIGGAEYGVAKGVKIVPVRVLDTGGSGLTDDVVAGVDWVAGHAGGPSVANLSFDGGADDALDQAVQGAVAHGVTFVVAAGNESADARGYSPARVGTALTVGAVDRTDRRAGFSNYGDDVDLYAPGVDILSAWGSGDAASETLSGTSAAAPYVAGAAALYLSAHPSATPAQVAAALMAGASRGEVPELDTHPPAVTGG